MITHHRNSFVRIALACGFFAAVSWAVLPRSASAQVTNQPSQPDSNCGGPSTTTTPTNAGTQFLLCFEENVDTSGIRTDADGYLDVYIASLGAIDTVTITCNRYTSMHKVFVLQPNASMTYHITDDTLRESFGIIDTMRDLFITSHDVADNRVVQVQATSPIVCYGMDSKPKSADAFLALPFQSAGTDYRVLSYPNSVFSSAGSNTPSQFAVAAFKDNTTVTITPSVPTSGGHAAGVPFTVTLQTGEGVQIQTDKDVTGLDLTGSIVSSDKAVTVYGSHVRAEVPSGYIAGYGGTSRDILLEAMPPTSTWGKAFVLNSLEIGDAGEKRPEGDLMRVLALYDNTIVKVNGASWVTLSRNQFSDSMVTGPVLVEGSGPLLVGEYPHTATAIAPAPGGNGDPSLAIVPSIDQTYNSYTFFASEDNAYNIQKVVIATDVRSQGAISLDGTMLPSTAFTPVPTSYGGQSFSIFEYGELALGAHTISTPNPPEMGFTILSYGLGDDISYAYTAGILLVPKRALQIDYPPQSMGKRHTNAIDFRNTAYEPAYVDSAVFVPSNPKTKVFGVHFQERVAFDIGRIEVGQGAQIHLVSDLPLSFPVSGTVKLYSHLPSFFDIEPAEMPFTLYPDASAGVSPQDALRLTVTATPNPFTTFTTITFSVPEMGDVTMTLFDELGRAVQHIASGEFAAGPYSVRLDRRGLAHGVYTCVIASQKLNINERVAIVVGE